MPSDRDLGGLRYGEPIAVIGMACRYAGANDLGSFWEMLRSGRDAIRRVPPERWSSDDYPAARYPGMEWGGFLDEIDRFDASFFGISPRKAHGMDPQQRLILETGWEAIEDAGLVPDTLRGTRTAVFVGQSYPDYTMLQGATRPDADIYLLAGCAASVTSGRLSHALGLRGIDAVVDTACSSSLTAIHLATQSLWSGETDLALVGGVNVILMPHPSSAFAQARLLAPDGRCRAFDAHGQGLVRGEGAGVVVLKPLSLALADQDRIYALVRGSAVNHDGRGEDHLMHPSQEAQEAVIRAAYRRAGVEASCVDYVEAHGTGTVVGDFVEARALGAVVGDRPANRPCYVGSLKGNIGHAEPAAGVAGFIKAVLCLWHREIPPIPHFKEPNPRIAWDELRLAAADTLRPWPEYGRPAVAGVSSFGINGTNAHVVIEQAPRTDVVHRPAQRAAYLLPISARDDAALREMASRYRCLLAADDGPALADLCHTAGVRRAHHDHRLAVTASSHAGLVELLDAFLAGEVRPGLSRGRIGPGRQAGAVLVFPGQGAQSPRMVHQLLADEPVFSRAIDACQAAMQDEVDWALRDVLEDPAGTLLERIDVVQPALFAVQVGLAALWRSWGVVPSAVVGHSLGEVAAALVAGALTLRDAARVACRRSALLRTLSGSGAMAVVDLPLQAAEEAVAAWDGVLSVAANNGPTTCLVSGETGAVEELIADMGRREVFCRRLKADVAGHSRAIDPILPALREALSGLQGRPTDIPFYSTVTGAPVPGAELDADYWVRNVREPVLFAAVTRRLLEQGCRAFVEISPHPSMLGAIEQSAHEAGKPALALPSVSRGHPQGEVMLGSLGALYVLGHPVDWSGRYPSGQRVNLPRYAWQRERFWLGPSPDGRRTRAGEHPLLGQHLLAATAPGTHLWTAQLGVEPLPYLRDHRIHGDAALPATAYLELALAAATHILNGAPGQVERLELTAPMFLPEDGALPAQLVATVDPAGTAALRLYSRPPGAAEPAWTLHARGLLRAAPADDAGTPPAMVDLEPVRARCPHPIDPARFYRALDAAGMRYGPAFRGIRQLCRGDGEALARVEPPIDATEAQAYRIHPAMLDACLQTLAAALPTAVWAAGECFLPVHVERFAVYRRPDPAGCWAYAQQREASGSRLTGDVRLLDSDGLVLATVDGLTVARLAGAEPSAAVADLLYTLSWEPKPHPDPGLRGPGGADLAGTWVVVSEDAGIAGGIRQGLQERGLRCVNLSDGADLGPLLDDGHTGAVAGIVYRTTLTDGVPLGLLRLTQTLATRGWTGAVPRLFILTAGAQAVGDEPLADPAQATAWGLGRTVRHEHPELRPTMIDLPPGDGAVEPGSVLAELLRGDGEDEIVLRAGARYVARLVPAGLPPLAARSAPDQRPFRVYPARAGTPGELELRVAPRRAPAPEEVEVEVVAAGLTGPQMLTGSGGTATATRVGAGVSGRVAALGAGVDGLAVGDEVVAVAGSASGLGSFVTVPAGLVQPKPAGLSHREAAGFPVALLTAYYALVHLARLRAGESVLIDRAAGGVACAAAQVAHLVGAQVYATGAPDNGAYLQSLGVRYVIDPDPAAFAEEIMARTGGHGVDVVLRSGGGERFSPRLELLCDGGRFVHLDGGEAGTARQGVPPRANISFSTVDIDDLATRDPVLLAGLFQEIVGRVAAGTLRPLPYHAFPVADIADAVRFLADDRSLGTVVVSVQDGPATVQPPEAAVFRADATYLITGGLGGLGLCVAEWMIEHGARHLLLIGRSAPGPRALATLATLRERGADLTVASADVADERQLRAVLAGSATGGPPLRGVVHAAGVLDDGLLLQLTPHRFARVLAPKVTGGWHLHNLTRDADLDFFVLFSSAAGLLGSPGQANYAAANAYLDALAHHRRGLGLPALSIDWGTWARVGQATLPGRADRLSNVGIGSLEPEQATRALGVLLDSAATQAAVMRFDVERWRAVYPAELPLLSKLDSGAAAPPKQPAASAEGEQIRAAVGNLSHAEASHLIEELLCDRLGRVLGLTSRRLDPQLPLNRTGIDSLMALELRNRLQQELGVQVGLAVFFKQPTIAQLADQLARQLRAVHGAADGEWEEGKL